MSNNDGDAKKRKVEEISQGSKQKKAFNEPVVQPWALTYKIGNETRNIRYPCQKTFERAAELSVEYDRPILMDYWHDSFTKNAYIGVHAKTETHLLIKSSKIFTSNIKRMIQSPKFEDPKDKTSPGELILMTENSIYIVDRFTNPKNIKELPDDTEN